MDEPKLSIRKRQERSGAIRAHYVCYRCQTGWRVTYPGPWALLDPMFKRDVCPSCGAGAAILSGYEGRLDLDAPPHQLELDL